MLVRWLFAYVAFMVTVGGIVGSAVLFYPLFESNIGVGMLLMFLSVVGVGGAGVYWANYLAVGWWGHGWLISSPSKDFFGIPGPGPDRRRERTPIFSPASWGTGHRSTNVFTLVLGSAFVAFLVWIAFLLGD